MRGVEIAKGKLNPVEALMDIEATVDSVRESGPGGSRVLLWLSACEVANLACAVSYYGGGIVDQLGKSPKVPVQFHFAEQDAHIPMSDVNRIRGGVPQCTLYTYDADHGLTVIIEQASMKMLPQLLKTDRYNFLRNTLLSPARCQCGYRNPLVLAACVNLKSLNRGQKSPS